LEEIEMGAIGRLLALTGNDEVNSLAALHFGEVFGRADTYQLAPIALGSTRRETSGKVIRGRQLFDEHASHSELNDRMVAGAVIKKTGLTNEFDYHAFVERYGPSSILLSVVTPNGSLVFDTTDQPVAPKSGDAVIALVDPVDDV
ncbi:MAG TPA: sodium:proton exchanger, partial [Pirellulales bacterium]|nr:sodium:proton exchanger [Pirellulales bacterium]